LNWNQRKHPLKIDILIIRRKKTSFPQINRGNDVFLIYMDFFSGLVSPF